GRQHRWRPGEHGPAVLRLADGLADRRPAAGGGQRPAGPGDDPDPVHPEHRLQPDQGRQRPDHLHADHRQHRHGPEPARDRRRRHGQHCRLAPERRLPDHHHGADPLAVRDLGRHCLRHGGQIELYPRNRCRVLVQDPGAGLVRRQGRVGLFFGRGQGLGVARLVAVELGQADLP
ncbi:MAG: hypothetical protein AVDCRST_MAG71-377, partial [uncultured Lysobacter sp.]